MTAGRRGRTSNTRGGKTINRTDSARNNRTNRTASETDNARNNEAEMKNKAPVSAPQSHGVAVAEPVKGGGEAEAEAVVVSVRTGAVPQARETGGNTSSVGASNTTTCGS